jgi:hypothetical protein
MLLCTLTIHILTKKGERTMNAVDMVAIKAWEAAITNGGDPEEWATKLGFPSLEELLRRTEVNVYPVVKALVESKREEVLGLFPEKLRPYIVVTVVKPGRTASTSTSTSSSTGSGRGKAYAPRLDSYRWMYKGKTASIRRQGDGWEAEFNGEVLGVYETHTKAIEAIYRLNGVESAINAVKLARMREQEAAALVD